MMIFASTVILLFSPAVSNATPPRPCLDFLEQLKGEFLSTSLQPMTQAEVDLVLSFEKQTPTPAWYVPGLAKGSIGRALPSFFHGGKVGGLVGRTVAVLTTENITIPKGQIGFGPAQPGTTKRIVGVGGTVIDMEPSPGFESRDSWILRFAQPTGEIRVRSENLRRLRVLRHPALAISSEPLSPLQFAKDHGLRGAVDKQELGELKNAAIRGLEAAVAQEGSINKEGQWINAFANGGPGGQIQSGDVLVGVELYAEKSEVIGVRVIGGPFVGVSSTQIGTLGFRTMESREREWININGVDVAADRLISLYVYRSNR